MINMLKKTFCALAAFCATVAVFAANGNVAKVGNTEYATIDEAIANWTNGSTLTLLADVTLSDVIKLNSTEHHLLNLGTFTMTAASKKDAIEIVPCGVGTASKSCLTIDADSQNPGGIVASEKACIYYYNKDKINDRMTVTVNGGTFSGSYAINSLSGSKNFIGVVQSPLRGQGAPYYVFNGGVFNAQVFLNAAMLKVTGGTFHKNLSCYGDITAYRLISGGRFSGMTMTADAEGKFTIGSAKSSYNVGLYVDKEGYLVVGGPVITELSATYPAVASNYSKWSSYLKYSSAATYGLFYTDKDVAIKKHGADYVTIWEKPAVTIPENVMGEATVVEEIKNNTALKGYTPSNLPTGAELEIELKSVGETIVYDVTPMANGAEVEPTEAITFRLPVPASVTKAYAKVFHEGSLMGIYAIKGEGNAKFVEVSSADFSEFAVEPTETVPVASINGVGFATFAEVLSAASAMTGDVTVEVLEKVTLNGPLTGSYASIKFVGKTENAEIYLDVQGYIEAVGKNVAFENLKLSKVAGGYVANAGFMNLAFGIYGATEVTYTNCTFLNGAYASSGKNTFTGCTFYRSHDRYGLWAYGATEIVVDGCTFADIRGIKMYDEGKFGTTSITVKNTSFAAVTDKPAIVLTYGNSVTLENNTYNADKGTFELDLDGAPNGVTVTSDVAPTCVNDNGACGVLVDGKIYTTVAQAAAVATAGSSVTLLHNSVETVAFPIGVNLDKNGFEAAGVSVLRPVAKIGDTNYETLADAFAAAKSGDTVTLLGDCKLENSVNFDTPITVDGAGYKVSASRTTGVSEPMFNVRTTMTVKNITLDACHKFTYCIEAMGENCDLTVTDVTLLYPGKINDSLIGQLGGGISVNNGKLKVSGSFTAFSGGESDGSFPFTGILIWDQVANVRFEDGATASIADPTGKTNESDLLLIGAPVMLDVETANLMLSQFKIPGQFVPYTLAVGSWGFTGASPLPWNKIIYYGKEILKVIGENPNEIPAQVGLLQDTEIPEVFIFEDANFSINGNGKKLTGTIDFTDSVGTIENVELTSETKLVMTNVTEGCVKLGEDVIITSPVKVIPPDNFGRGEDSATLIEFAEGSELSLKNFEIDTSTVQLPEGSQIVQDGNKIIVKLPIAKIGDTYYASLEAAAAAAKAGDEIVLLLDATLSAKLTLPAGITFNGNGKSITGAEVWADGNLAFVGHTKMQMFNAGYNTPTITIGEGACLELTGTGRMVIGHGATFNITGNIADAKTANVAEITPSLIAAGASFTGAGVNFNVNNAYVKFTAYCSSKNSSANGTFNINVTNSIWEQSGSLVFTEPTNGKDPTFNFNVVNSVLKSTSHLVFGVTKGEIVFDNSNVNVGANRQLENRSTLTIKNGSVVYAAYARSSNAKNPGTTIVENATLVAAGEFTGAEVGTGTLVVKSGANVTMGNITQANIQIDATDMTEGELANFTANLSDFAGTLEVVNNNSLEAKIVDGKILLEKKPVAKIGDVKYLTFSAAVSAAQEGDIITLLADIELADTVTIAKSIAIDGNGKRVTTADGFAANGSNAMIDIVKNVTFGNIVFDGVKNVAVMRSVGGDIVMDQCVVKNCNQTVSQGLLRLACCDATITDCQFVDNTCTMVVSFGYDAANDDDVLWIDGCSFERNTCKETAVVYMADGDYGKVTDTLFADNNVSSAGNAATLYMGLGDGFEVSGCTFKDNTVVTSHATTKRFASAIFCDGCTVKENAFIGNTATRNGETIATIVAVGAYYGAADISANYWGKAEPDAGVDFTVEYTRQDVAFDSYYTSIDEDGNLVNLVSFVAQIGDVKYTSFEAAAAAIATDGSDTTIKLLRDIELSDSIEFAYGTGKIHFTADTPVVVKQTKVGSDLAFTIGKPANIIVDKNVTFEIYDNASGMYLYYGPSLTVNGTITGGQNWGCLYLFNGTHLVNKGGRVEVGRIQAAFNTVNMKGTVDTNYLLVEGATFNAEGAVVDAGAIHDSNNGGTRWGASTFNFLKGTKVTANTITLKYADSVINTDLTSEIKASKIIGTGTIKIDARTVVDTEKQMIFADMSEFTGRIEVVGGDYEIVADGVVITKNTANAFFDGYYYETFKGAFTAAVESDKGKASITVLGNSAVDYEMEIPAGKSIILDLDGKTLAKADGAKIVVDNAIVKIANGTLSGFSASDVEIKGDSVATFPSETVDLAGFADSFYKTMNEDGSVSVATKFRSFIQVESGVPCIGFLKNATSEYKVYGKAELTDADWELLEMDSAEDVVSDNPALPLKWYAPTGEAYRFFKVEKVD